jgi:hypothetical protein
MQFIFIFKFKELGVLNRDVRQIFDGHVILALLATCFHAGFLLGLHIYPEDGGGMFLRNVR